MYYKIDFVIHTKYINKNMVPVITNGTIANNLYL